MDFTAAYSRGATRKAKKLRYGSRSIEEGKGFLLPGLNSVLGGGRSSLVGILLSLKTFAMTDIILSSLGKAICKV